MLQITNRLLKEEAERRGWKVGILHENGAIYRYTLPDGTMVLLQSLLSPFVSAMALKIAGDKYATYELARLQGIPAPDTHVFSTLEEATKLLERYETVVVKPLDAAHGNGVTANITSRDLLQEAINTAREFGDVLLLQPHILGKDIRLLYIGYELAAAAIRHPAAVVGDGISTIRTLIENENRRPDRGSSYEKRLSYIDIEAAARYMKKDMDKILTDKETCVVVGTANIGTGGMAEDITSTVPRELVEAGRKILKAVGARTGAADFIWNGDDYYLLEININPSLGLHEKPSIGSPQPVAKKFIDWITEESKILSE